MHALDFRFGVIGRRIVFNTPAPMAFPAKPFVVLPDLFAASGGAAETGLVGAKRRYRLHDRLTVLGTPDATGLFQTLAIWSRANSHCFLAINLSFR